MPIRSILASLLLGASTAFLAAWLIAWRGSPFTGTALISVRPPEHEADRALMYPIAARTCCFCWYAGFGYNWHSRAGIDVNPDAPWPPPSAEAAIDPREFLPRYVQRSLRDSGVDIFNMTTGIPREHSVASVGWPRPCLWWERSFRGAVAGGIEVPLTVARRSSHAWLNRPPESLVLPYRVLPLQFALSAGIFSTLWLTAFTAARVARRHLRARRGLCPFCAYDRRGLAQGSPCPECGTKKLETQEPPAPPGPRPAAGSNRTGAATDGGGETPSA